MTVAVLLFGPQALLAGTRCLRLEVTAEPATAADVKRAIAAAAPAIAATVPSSRLAVNHELVSDEAAVAPADELALIGMVSGG